MDQKPGKNNQVYHVNQSQAAAGKMIRFDLKPLAKALNLKTK